MRILAFHLVILCYMLVPAYGQEVTSTSTDTFNVVEQMPEFRGGEPAFYSFLDKNLNYPNEAKSKGIQGKVWLSFIINEDGRVSNVEILRGIGGGCEQEAKRVMELMPPWIPGKQDGKAVKVRFRFPINFTLADNSTKTKTKKNKE